MKNAAEYLRRMAPTQSHELRHEFQTAAQILDYVRNYETIEDENTLHSASFWGMCTDENTDNHRDYVKIQPIDYE
jgi:hypothetical protein